MTGPRSNAEWKAWGREDPLFGVASWPGRAKGDADAWNLDAFYAIGATDWRDCERRWRRYGLRPGACVEIGCGAGRMTKPLATTFDEVVALDVSEDMLAVARANASAPGVSYRLTDGVTLALEDASMTAAFSTHVFQHFDDLSTARRYFREIARVLTSGGTMMIHLPVHGWPSMPRLFDGLYRARKRVGDLRALVRQTLLATGLGRPFMRGLSYPIAFFHDELPALGLGDVDVVAFAPQNGAGTQAFVFATRDPSRARTSAQE